HSNLALLARETGQILRMHIEQSRSHLMDGLHHIGTSAYRVPDVDAATHPWVHVLHRLQHIERRMPYLVLWPVVMDRQPDVILLHELFNAWKDLRRGIAGNDHRDPGPFCVIELAPDIVIFI